MRGRADDHLRQLQYGLLVAALVVAGCTGGSLDKLSSAHADGGSSGAAGSGGAGGAAGTGGAAGADGGTGKCVPGPGQKYCGSQSCPSTGDPSHGCALASCAPCQLPNATADCAADGACGVQSCDPGFSDCDGDSANGCEINVQSDPHHCGGCNADCFGTSAQNWDCVQGACQLSSCAQGTADCDQSAGNGCEADVTSDVKNCAYCGHVCNIPHAVAKCSASKCVLDACEPGWEDCDGDPFNGCEQDIATDATHCGSCTGACSSVNGSPACQNGQCTISCAAGWGNCNGSVDDGCETSLSSNSNNCGACGRGCSKNHDTPNCMNGSCAVSCDQNWGDCDANATNGCETDLTTDSDCGACGVKCGWTKVCKPQASGYSCG